MRKRKFDVQHESLYHFGVSTGGESALKVRTDGGIMDVFEGIPQDFEVKNGESAKNFAENA